MQVDRVSDTRGRLTIGWGHTGRCKLLPMGDVHDGDVITQHQADVIFDYDLSWAEDAVNELCPGLDSNQFSACCSLVFNIGVTEFAASVLLKRLKAADLTGVAFEWRRWNHSDGKVLDELTRRRADELALFQGGAC